MATPITRAVRFMSNIHSHLRSTNGETILNRTIFSEQHFPKFLAVACVVSTVGGFYTMDYIRETHNREVMEAYRKDEEEYRAITQMKRRLTSELKRYPTWNDSHMVLRAGNE